METTIRRIDGWIVRRLEGDTPVQPRLKLFWMNVFEEEKAHQRCHGEWICTRGNGMIPLHAT